MLSTVLTIALSALLQGTHPCDAAITPNVQTKIPYSVGFCWNQKDVDGILFTVAELATIQVKIVIDGVINTTVPLPTTGAGSPTGQYFYVVPNISSAKGTHTVAVIMVSSEDGAPSPPYGFKVIGAPPSAASKTQVQPKP